MGFGSYDESEQETGRDEDESDVEAVNVEENAHAGDVSFESDASTSELVDRLEGMKDDGDDAEER